jgi:hypothetical protein
MITPNVMPVLLLRTTRAETIGIPNLSTQTTCVLALPRLRVVARRAVPLMRISTSCVSVEAWGRGLPSARH